MLTTLIYIAGTMHKLKTYYQFHTINERPMHVPFPAATTGFLYYHRDSVYLERFDFVTHYRTTQPLLRRAPISSCLIPWRIPLVGIAKRTSPPSHMGLKELLLRDNLVTTTTMDECARMKVSRGSRVIHSLGLCKSWLAIACARNNQQRSTAISGVFYAKRLSRSFQWYVICAFYYRTPDVVISRLSSVLF
jgi:hypothetical protein